MVTRTRTLRQVLALVLSLLVLPRAAAQTSPLTDELVVCQGSYQVDGGWFATFGNQTQQFAFQRWNRLPFAAYNAANGETRAACGDFDGDGKDEIAVGIGTYRPSGGFVAVFDDAANKHRFLRWVRVRWSLYNAANGSTLPAAGDLDGDGRAELVVGLGRYTARGGMLAIFDDAHANFRLSRWLRLPFAAYNAANGETRPAVGDLDGDGRAEIAVGTGSYPQRGGIVALYEDARSSHRFTGWARMPWSVYNAANGETWPAIGDVDGDRRGELILGQGTYRASGGFACVLRRGQSGYRRMAWVRLGVAAYQSANGEVRPAAGDFDGDGRDELALGIGTYRAGGGFVYLRDDARAGFASRGSVRLPSNAYNAANGATRPAAGNLR